MHVADADLRRQLEGWSLAAIGELDFCDAIPIVGVQGRVLALLRHLQEKIGLFGMSRAAAVRAAEQASEPAARAGSLA